MAERRDIESELVVVPGADAPLQRVTVGDARVTCLPDMDRVAWPATNLFAALTPDMLKIAEAGLPPGVIDAARNTIALSFNTYLVEVAGDRILIDAGIGDRKDRLDRPAWHQRSSPFLRVLSGLGVEPDDVGLVVNTHLHADHVGWNTVWDGSQWQPTFPRARYVVARGEAEFWAAQHAADPSGGTLHGAYVDSVLPVLEAGRVTVVDPPCELRPGLFLDPAPGHSPGMCVVRLVREGQEIRFLSDTIHHQLQLLWPDICSRFCEDPDRANRTREALLAAAERDGVVVAAYHFPPPVFGRALRDGAGFTFKVLPEKGPGI